MALVSVYVKIKTLSLLLKYLMYLSSRVKSGYLTGHCLKIQNRRFNNEYLSRPVYRLVDWQRHESPCLKMTDQLIKGQAKIQKNGPLCSEFVPF